MNTQTRNQLIKVLKKMDSTLSDIRRFKLRYQELGIPGLGLPEFKRLEESVLKTIEPLAALLKEERQ